MSRFARGAAVFAFAVVVVIGCVKSLEGSRCDEGNVCGDASSGFVCLLPAGTCVAACPSTHERCAARCVPQGECAAPQTDAGADAGVDAGAGEDAGQTDGGEQDGGTDAGVVDAGFTCLTAPPPLILSPRSTYLPKGATGFTLRWRSLAPAGCEFQLDHDSTCAVQETDGGRRCLVPGNTNFDRFTSVENPATVPFTQSPGKRYMTLRACDQGTASCGPPSVVRVVQVGQTPGDVDGDGNADIVLGTADSAVQLGEFRSGNGYAYDPITIGSLSEPTSLAGLGDFTGDGLSDVAVVGGSTGGATPVVLGGSSSGLNVNHSENVGSTSTSVAGVGDINGDGFMDLAIVDPMRTGGPVRLSFGPNALPLDYTSSVGFMPSYAVGLGDINDDGFDDFAVVGATNAVPAIRVWTGRADLPRSAVTADPHVELGGPGSGVSAKWGTGIAAVGDVNGDGVNDLAVGHSDLSKGPYFYFGSRDDKVNQSPGTAIDDGPFTIVPAGQLEGASGPVEYLTLLGSGVSLCQVTSATSTQCDAVSTSPAEQYGAVGDVDGDGRPDVALTSLSGANVFKVYGRDSSGNVLTVRSGPAPGTVPGLGRLLARVPAP